MSALASRYDMSNMRCFPIVGMEKQHDAILESFGTNEIIYSLTRLPSTTYSLLSSSTLEILNFPPLFALLNLRNYSESNSDLAAKSLLSKLFQVKFWLSRKTLISENILNQVLT